MVKKILNPNLLQIKEESRD